MKKFLLQSVTTWRWQFHCRMSCQAKRPEVSISAGFVLPLRRQSVWPCMPYYKRKKNKHFFCPAVLVAVLQLCAPAWIWEMSDITQASWVLLHTTSAAEPIHPHSITSEDDSAEVRVLDGSLSNSILPASWIPPPPQPRLPAALPACLEPVSNYLDLCLPAFLTSHSARLSLIFCTILAPCLHLS